MKLPFQIDLSGKVAVVTGAGGVLCSEMAKALAACGAKVALVGRTLENVQRVADEITADGGVARAYQGNVLDRAGMEAVAEQVKNELGLT
ncbi:MAG: SDR family NAD(P)-dependent oxidoreductase, partial [Oscillospiraceae bacterium]|nr:SDR family NAD(P)-dependent oxidoreductase [Oscillospiraceae bacterium]